MLLENLILPLAGGGFNAGPDRLGGGAVSNQFGVPNGIRTRVTALKGLRPRPLDDGDFGVCDGSQTHCTAVERNCDL